MTKLYCMYQKIDSEYVVFGIGNTPEAARSDAEANAENTDTLQISECTQELYSWVLENGGYAHGIRFSLDNGVLGVE